MKLGLGLSLPGVAAQQGKAGERILSTAKHLYDARRGSSFTDYGSGGVNGAAAASAALPSHSGKWWTFDGNDDAVDLWPRANWTLGASDERTFVMVMKRDSASNPGAIVCPFSFKDVSTTAERGFRVIANTNGSISVPFGDGTNASTKTSATGLAVNGTVVVVVVRLGSSLFDVTFNTAAATEGTSRGSVANGSPASIANARVGTNANALTSDYDGSIGVVACYDRLLTTDERSLVVDALSASFA